MLICRYYWMIESWRWSGESCCAACTAEMLASTIAMPQNTASPRICCVFSSKWSMPSRLSPSPSPGKRNPHNLSIASSGTKISCSWWIIPISAPWTRCVNNCGATRVTSRRRSHHYHRHLVSRPRIKSGNTWGKSEKPAAVERMKCPVLNEDPGALTSGDLWRT